MPSPKNRPQQAAENGFWDRAQVVLQVAGGVVALVGFVWLVGGAVMWFRFDKAGVPADAAVAVMSREQLFVVGFRLMVLPACVAGVLAFLLLRWVEGNSRRSGPNTVRLSAAKRWAIRVVAALIALALLYPFIRVLEAVGTATGKGPTVIVAAVAALVLTTLLARLFSRDRWLFWVGAAVFVMWLCLLPVSWASLVWVLAALFAAWYAWPKLWSRDGKTQHGGAIDDSGGKERAAETPRTWRARPVVIVTVAALFAAFVALAQQTDQPVQLLHVDATLAQGKSTRTVQGVFVASDAGSVYVGRSIDDKIVALKRDDIRRLTLGPPDIQAPKSSALSALLVWISDDAHRFSTKGYAWWCDGVQYGWTQVIDQRFCRTQPQVLPEQYQHTTESKITRETDTRRRATRHLHGRYAPVRVGCPTLAERPCRGFVKLTSESRFPYTRWTRESEIELGPLPLPARELEPNSAAEICLRLSSGDLHRIHEADQPEVKFTAIVSSDEAGDNVLDESPYILRVPRDREAATGERDASDCPPGMQIFGLGVTPRYAPRATQAFRFTYHVNRAATVSIMLRDSAGRVIRPLVRDERVSPEGRRVLQDGKLIDDTVKWPMITGGGRLWKSRKTVDWDPVDGHGRPLPQGVYDITLVAVGRDGTPVRARRTVAIDAHPPRVLAINGGFLVAKEALVIEVRDRVSGVREAPQGGRCRHTKLTVGGENVRRVRCAWLHAGQLQVVYRPDSGWEPGETYAWSLSAIDRARHAVTEEGRVVAVARARRPQPTRPERR